MTQYLGAMTDVAVNGNTTTEPYTVTPTASPYTFTAPMRGFLNVAGGTVSAVGHTRNSAHALGNVSGCFPMSLGDKLTITYSAAPTLTFIPH